MTSDDHDIDLRYDLSKIIVRPLYFAMLSNIAIPAGLLIICYYIHTHGGRRDLLGESAMLVFAVLGCFALAETGMAFFLRYMMLKKPMIKTRDTFEQDITEGLFRACLIPFIMISSISVYGAVYYFLSGKLEESAAFVIFSFLAFQFIRPRYGMAKNLIKTQQALIDQGKFAQ